MRHKLLTVLVTMAVIASCRPGLNLAYWRFDDTAGEMWDPQDLCRKANFFQNDFVEGIPIATKPLARIQNLYASKFPFRVIISGNPFGKVFSSDSSFFKSDVEGVNLRIICDSHISSFSRIIYINRYYDFSSTPKADLFFSMFAKADRFRDIIHSFNISRRGANVKDVRDTVIASCRPGLNLAYWYSSQASLRGVERPLMSLRGAVGDSVIASLPKAGEAISDFLCPSAYAADKGNAPVAHWRFDEGGGPTAYDEIGTNDGTLTPGDNTGSNDTAGEMWSTAGKIGSALECDGTNDYVDLPSSANFAFGTGPFTVEIWYNLSELTSPNTCLISLGGSNTNYGAMYGYAPNQNCDMLYYANGKRIFDTVTPSINTWYFATLVGNGGVDGSRNIKMYKNAVQVGSTYTYDYNFPQQAFVIGANQSSYSEVMHGLIDDVRIYNYARTAAQVMVDYNAGSAAHLGAGTDPNEGNPPVAYYTMDRLSGTTLYDTSGNNNNGTITGATSTAGKYGSALSFDGNDYVDCGDLSILEFGTGDFTLLAWIKTTSPTDRHGILGTYYGGNTNSAFILRNGTGGSQGKIQIMVLGSGSWGSSAGSVLSINDNEWHHVVGLRENGMLKIYIDGNQDGTPVSNSIDLGSSMGALAIGSEGGSGQGFSGQIDEVKIYNYARTPAQIAYDYNRGKPVAHYKFDEGAGTIAHNEYSTAGSGAAAPVGWWRMDEATSGSANGTNNILDESGNGNHGSGNYGANLTGMSWTSGKIGPGALSFDGADDYVDCGNSNDYKFGTGDFTVSFWMKADTWEHGSGEPTEYMVLMGNGNYGTSWDGIHFGRVGSWWATHLGVTEGSIMMMLGNGTNNEAVSSNEVLSTGAWYHVAGTRQSGTTYFYLNGVRKSNASIGYDVTVNRSLMIGKQNDTTYPRYFDGLIDDVRIYNYARTPEQIYNDYKTTHGTLVGDTKFVDGKIGKALSFDGSGDYVEIPDDAALDTTTAFTFSAWVKANNIATEQMIFSNTNASIGWHLEIFQSKLLMQVYPGGAYTSSTNTMSSNVWQHIAVTYNNGTIAYYLNGSPNGTGSYTFTAPTGLNKRIGIFFNGSYPFTGLIDDVRIYNYALVTSEVAQDYADGAARLGAQATGEADPWGGAMPVGHWKLDENTGVLARDASGNGYDGTITGSSWIHGKLGPCLNFSATNDKVQTSDPILSGTGDFTITAWINRSVAGTVDYIAGNYGGAPYTTGIEFYAHNNVLYVYISGSVNGATTLSADTWYHVSVTRTSGAIKLYVNGKEDGSGTLASSISGGNWAIGNGPNYTSERFEGKIDDVKVYNYARTQAQVAWDYNAGKPVAHYRFNESSGTDAWDESGNNNGTVTIGGTGSQLTIAAARTAGATGKFGRCMSFDGTDDYANISTDTVNTSSDFTVEAWVKKSDKGATADNDRIFSLVTDANNGFQLIFDDATQKYAALLERSGANTINQLTYGSFDVAEWIHVAYVVSGSSGTFYKNGQSLASDGSTSIGTGDTASYDIGRRGDGVATTFFSGLIDDVRIYNYARTAAQVLQDFNAGAASRLSD